MVRMCLLSACHPDENLPTAGHLNQKARSDCSPSHGILFHWCCFFFRRKSGRYCHSKATPSSPSSLVPSAAQEKISVWLSLLFPSDPGFSRVAPMINNLPGKEGEARDESSIPRMGSIPWSRKWQFTPLFLPRESYRGIWQATVNGVAKSWTRMGDWTQWSNWTHMYKESSSDSFFQWVLANHLFNNLFHPPLAFSWSFVISPRLRIVVWYLQILL